MCTMLDGFNCKLCPRLVTRESNSHVESPSKKSRQLCSNNSNPSKNNYPNIFSWSYFERVETELLLSK